MTNLEFYQGEIDLLPTIRKKINYLNRAKVELEYRVEHMKSFKWFMGELVRPSQVVANRDELKTVNQLLNQLKP